MIDICIQQMIEKGFCSLIHSFVIFKNLDFKIVQYS